MTNRPLST